MRTYPTFRRSASCLACSTRCKVSRQNDSIRWIAKWNLLSWNLRVPRWSHCALVFAILPFGFWTIPKHELNFWIMSWQTKQHPHSVVCFLSSAVRVKVFVIGRLKRLADIQQKLVGRGDWLLMIIALCDSNLVSHRYKGIASIPMGYRWSICSCGFLLE